MPPPLDIKNLVSGQQTAGALAVFVEIVPPGIGPPRHVHSRQIEVFHVISGTFLFEVDGVRTVASAGEVAVVPVGTVHAFRNIGAEPATLHFELLPALNSEQAFAKMVSGDIGDPETFFDTHFVKMTGPPLEQP